MQRAIVTVRAVVEAGSIVDLDIRQECPPDDPAAVFWPRPRRVDGVIHLFRRVLRIARTRTREAADA